MKNVMVRAWEIAKAAVVKFGGKVKEYFAQALAQAWREVKKTVSEHFGYIFAGKNEGMILFALDNIEGLHVYPVHNDRNPQFELKYRLADHKPTGKKVRLYSAESYHADLEIVCGNQSEVMTVRRGEVSFN